MPRLSSAVRHLNYANVMATVAVFVSLGGASYAAIKLPANSVGTTQIKSRAVTKAKLDPKLVRTLKGASGPAGAQGPVGPAGPQGPAGGGGAVQRIEGQSPVSTSSTAGAVATCPAGTRAVGGGGKAEGVGAPGLRSSVPTADGTGWTVQGYGDGGPWQVTAVVLCAKQ